MAPLVSDLIPAYNAERRRIGATIDSALNQTWEKKEIIIVDDGSTDNTLLVARRRESTRLKVLTQENSGACAARNYALATRRGDYVQWLEADDLLAPQRIDLQLQRSESGMRDDVLHTGAWGQLFYRIERAVFRPDSFMVRYAGSRLVAGEVQDRCMDESGGLVGESPVDGCSGTVRWKIGFVW